MNIFLQLVSSAALLVIGGAAVWAAYELSQTRHLVEELAYRNFSSAPPPDDPFGVCGHAVFIAKDGQWILAEDMSRPGYRASPPTMEPGYDGQVITRPSARVPAS
jgi:hypothetical protein